MLNEYDGTSCLDALGAKDESRLRQNGGQNADTTERRTEGSCYLQQNFCILVEMYPCTFTFAGGLVSTAEAKCVCTNHTSYVRKIELSYIQSVICVFRSDPLPSGGTICVMTQFTYLRISFKLRPKVAEDVSCRY